MLLRGPLCPVAGLTDARRWPDRAPAGDGGGGAGQPRSRRGLAQGRQPVRWTTRSARRWRRYARRAAFRATPSGLLGGVALAALGARTRISSADVTGAITPAWGRLVTLGRGLLDEAGAARRRCGVRLCPSLVQGADELCWLRLDDDGLSVRSAAPDAALAALLARAQDWITWQAARTAVRRASRAASAQASDAGEGGDDEDGNAVIDADRRLAAAADRRRFALPRSGAAAGRARAGDLDGAAAGSADARPSGPATTGAALSVDRHAAWTRVDARRRRRPGRHGGARGAGGLARRGRPRLICTVACSCELRPGATVSADARSNVRPRWRRCCSGCRRRWPHRWRNAHWMPTCWHVWPTSRNTSAPARWICRRWPPAVMAPGWPKPTSRRSPQRCPRPACWHVSGRTAGRGRARAPDRAGAGARDAGRDRARGRGSAQLRVVLVTRARARARCPGHRLAARATRTGWRQQRPFRAFAGRTLARRPGAHGGGRGQRPSR